MRKLTQKRWLVGASLVVMVSLMGSSSMAAPPTWWTQWYDRDNPSGTGDWETRADHGNVCFGDTVLSIEGETLGGTPANQTGETFYAYNPYNGLICRNADQSDGYCQDYRVRYLCKGIAGP